jgi:hypothetical protein
MQKNPSSQAKNKLTGRRGRGAGSITRKDKIIFPFTGTYPLFNDI